MPACALLYRFSNSCKVQLRALEEHIASAPETNQAQPRRMLRGKPNAFDQAGPGWCGWGWIAHDDGAKRQKDFVNELGEEQGAVGMPAAFAEEGANAVVLAQRCECRGQIDLAVSANQTRELRVGGERAFGAVGSGNEKE